MRRIVLGGVSGSLALLALSAVLPVPTADAQVSNGRNPWCLRSGGSWDCSYRSFEQCNISGRYGLDGICVQNPEYRAGKRRPQNQGRW